MSLMQVGQGAFLHDTELAGIGIAEPGERQQLAIVCGGGSIEATRLRHPGRAASSTSVRNGCYTCDLGAAERPAQRPRNLEMKPEVSVS